MKIIISFFIIFLFAQNTFSQTYGEGGLGATIKIDTVSKYPFIVELKNDMPAKKIGLARNDVIVKINGYSTYNYSLNQVISEIRGKIGTICSLTVLRNNKEYPFTFTRAAIPQENDELSFSNKKVHEICELPEKRNVNTTSESYKLSESYLEDSRIKKGRSKHFLKLAVETCNDNLNAHLIYADSLKSWKDFFMRNKINMNGPPTPGDNKIYQPKNWQHFTSSHEDAYGHVLEQYNSVLAIDPNHLRSRLNVADIYYFNGQFDSCAKHLNLLFCAIPREQHNLEVCSQARRMARRCEWLKSLPENSIKLNTLYWDKGRAETLLFALGTIGMNVGEIYSYRSGKIDGALIGAGFNIATMALQKSRDNFKWFGKLQDAGDYKALYEKCQKQLPIRINTTGFYSYETMMMLSGIIHAGSKLDKPCTELKNNANALIDIIQIANPPLKTEYNDFKFIVRMGLEAGIMVANCDKSLLIYEELELYNFLLEYNKRLMDVGDKSFIPEKSIETSIYRRDLLMELVDSIGNPNFVKEKQEIRKKKHLEEKIRNALVSFNKNPHDIEARNILAETYEEQRNFKSAITHYEYLLNYYKEKKITHKTQEINIRLKACKLLLEKE